MNRELFARKLSELPVYIYDFFDPRELEFSERIRWICQTECPKYGTTWACPPGVGTVPECREKCLSYSQCLLISSIAEVEDISDIDETLATRPSHEELTEQVAALLRMGRTADARGVLADYKAALEESRRQLATLQGEHVWQATYSFINDETQWVEDMIVKLGPMNH